MRLRNIAGFIAMITLATVASAQTPVANAGAVQISGSASMPGKAGMISMHVDNMDLAPVKGAPFCATVTTEHTQSFADGNRIHTTDTSSMCRDSEGRTRREAGLNLLGAGAQKAAPKLITIVDPVAGVRYLLDGENKIAHKAALPAPGTHPSKLADGLPDKGGQVMIYQSMSADGPPPGPPPLPAGNFVFRKFGPDANEPAPATENLGEQTINGIQATGTRITTTIPSGKMGNEKPITVTSERWYSENLKAVVMTTHSDPWAGELKTEFSSVNTSEPDASLFTVPSDYKVVDDKNGPVTIRMSGPVRPQD
jgi:hypothetical protein